MTNSIQVQWPDLFKKIEGLSTDEANQIVIEREIIPIILVPGIMGSRLKGGSGLVWDPDSKWFMITNYLFRGPEHRKESLVGTSFQPTYLSVDTEGDSDHNESFEAFPGADKRGWPSVAWRAYGKILAALNGRIWSEPIRSCFEFPVHAFGYNWTDSSYNSGLLLSQYIENLIDTYAKGRICEKVVLVTHSMGGLVARSACCLHNAGAKVLGVIHGAQPATGAPATYQRMKAGWEDTGTGLVLGANGPQVTAVLGNIPGGLELLPNQNYTDNTGAKGWLYLPSLDGTVNQLPAADPYNEIYRNRSEYWRLIEPSWLGEVTQPKDGSTPVPAWDIFEGVLSTAEYFHNVLDKSVHPNTIQFHAGDLTTFARVTFERELECWSNKGERILERSLTNMAKGFAFSGILSVLNLRKFTPIGAVITALTSTARAVVQDSDWWANRGGFRTYTDEGDNLVGLDGKANAEVLYKLELKGPDGLGDGTVPVASAKFLEAEDSLFIGKEDEGDGKREHEGIYSSDTAQQITFAAIENLALKRIDEKT